MVIELLVSNYLQYREDCNKFFISAAKDYVRTGFKVARAAKSFLTVGRTVRKIRKVNRCFLNGLGRIDDEDAKGFANGERSTNGAIFVIEQQFKKCIGIYALISIAIENEVSVKNVTCFYLV